MLKLSNEAFSKIILFRIDVYCAVPWSSCVVTSTDGARTMPVSHSGLVWSGHSGAEAITAGSASQQSLYKQLKFQKSFDQNSNFLLIKCIMKSDFWLSLSPFV